MKTGATLGFSDGFLDIKISGHGDADGAGRISFKDDDLEWGDGEDSDWRSMKLPRSELEAIRDFLNKWLPPTPVCVVRVTDRGIIGDHFRTFSSREKADAFADRARKSIGWRSARVVETTLDDDTVPT